MSIQFILANSIIYLLGFHNEAHLKGGRDGSQLRLMDCLHRCGYGGVAVCVHVSSVCVHAHVRMCYPRGLRQQFLEVL